MDKEIIIRKYKKNDEYQILKLLNRNLNKQQHLNIERNIDWWKWKYEKNPFGDPIIYLGEYNKKVIAVRSFWPWTLNVRGKELISYQPLDSVVDKDFRRRGLFTKLTREFLQEHGDYIDLVYNFPNNQSLRGNL